MNPLDELQAQMDERFPRGAHVWILRKEGPDLTYVTPRVMVVAEGRMALPPADDDRDRVESYNSIRYQGIAVILRCGERVVRIDDNFAPTTWIDRRREQTCDGEELDLLRRLEVSRAKELGHFPYDYEDMLEFIESTHVPTYDESQPVPDDPEAHPRGPRGAAVNPCVVKGCPWRGSDCPMHSALPS